MRQGIGTVGTFNIIIIYIVVVFALLIGAINYYKAFKVNARILDIIEKYEGYNSLAVEEIDKYLDTIGYIRGNKGCDERSHDTALVTKNNGGYAQDLKYDYCVYYHSADGTSKDIHGTATYYNYSVETYIYIDLPFLNQIKYGREKAHGIPVYTKGERTYKFDKSGKNPLAK